MANKLSLSLSSYVCWQEAMSGRKFSFRFYLEWREERWKNRKTNGINFNTVWYIFPFWYILIPLWERVQTYENDLVFCMHEKSLIFPNCSSQYRKIAQKNKVFRHSFITSHRLKSLASQTDLFSHSIWKRANKTTPTTYSQQPGSLNAYPNFPLFRPDNKKQTVENRVSPRTYFLDGIIEKY